MLLTRQHPPVMLFDLRDCNMYQHVNVPTRHRINETNRILDLVLTICDNLIDNVESCAPLGKSDHNVLKFDIKCNTSSDESSSDTFLRKLIMHV